MTEQSSVSGGNHHDRTKFGLKIEMLFSLSFVVKHDIGIDKIKNL